MLDIGYKGSVIWYKYFLEIYVWPGNCHSSEYLKFSKAIDGNLNLLNTQRHTHEGNYAEVMDSLFRLTMVIVLQCMFVV